MYQLVIIKVVTGSFPPGTSKIGDGMVDEWLKIVGKF